MAVQHADESLVDLATGVTTAYDMFGDPGDPTLVLVAGLSCPMTFWPTGFCEALAEHGLHVVRFDNRDAGRATKLRHLGHSKRQLVSAFLGRRTAPPYTIADMADDLVALLDVLGVDRAHLVGQSMGGFIVQTAAIEHPERVASVTSISSSTGSRKVGRTSVRLLPGMLTGDTHDVDAYVESSLRTWRLIGSTDGRPADDELAEQARGWYERGYSASGVLRQMQAIVSQPDRSRDLATVEAPVLVIHGTHDRMVHVSGGRATSRHARHARLLTLPELGHDLPEPLWPPIIDAIVQHTSRR